MGALPLASELCLVAAEHRYCGAWWMSHTWCVTCAAADCAGELPPPCVSPRVLPTLPAATIEGDCSTLLAVGEGQDGQLGVSPDAFGEEDRQICTLARVALPTSAHVAHVACGWRHTAAILTDGQLWTWGHGKDGQLGHGACASLFVLPAARAVTLFGSSTCDCRRLHRSSATNSRSVPVRCHQCFVRVHTHVGGCTAFSGWNGVPVELG